MRGHAAPFLQGGHLWTTSKSPKRTSTRSISAARCPASRALPKNEWLKQRFAEGLVFYRSVERGKCFIEYIPAENAWVPITADGWLYINCLWVSGSMKGHGCSNDLLEKCLSDARAQGKKGHLHFVRRGTQAGISRRPQVFGPTRDLKSQMSQTVESLSCASRSTPIQHCRNSRTALSTLKLMRTASSSTTPISVPLPITWVPKVQQAAQQHNIPFRAIHITDKEAAQNVSAPVTTYALFRGGVFLTQGIQSDKKFLALAGVQI